MTDFNYLGTILGVFCCISFFFLHFINFATCVFGCFVSGHTFMARWGDTKNWRSQRLRKTARLFLSGTRSWRRTFRCVGVIMRRNGKYVQNYNFTITTSHSRTHMPKRMQWYDSHYNWKSILTPKTVCSCVEIAWHATEFSKWHSIQFIFFISFIYSVRCECVRVSFFFIPLKQSDMCDLFLSFLSTQFKSKALRIDYDMCNGSAQCKSKRSLAIVFKLSSLLEITKSKKETDWREIANTKCSIKHITIASIELNDFTAPLAHQRMNSRSSAPCTLYAHALFGHDKFIFGILLLLLLYRFHQLKCDSYSCKNTMQWTHTIYVVRLIKTKS